MIPAIASRVLACLFTLVCALEASPATTVRVDFRSCAEVKVKPAFLTELNGRVCSIYDIKRQERRLQVRLCGGLGLGFGGLKIEPKLNALICVTIDTTEFDSVEKLVKHLKEPANSAFKLMLLQAIKEALLQRSDDELKQHFNIDRKAVSEWQVLEPFKTLDRSDNREMNTWIESIPSIPLSIG